MVASIGKIASLAQGVGYFERDGYYAKDDGAHREASAWAGKGADALGIEGPVDPEAFRRVLEGEVPGRRCLGRREPDGTVKQRPGRDVTLSAPKSVSVMALVGSDDRIVGRTTRRWRRRWAGSRTMPSRPRCAIPRPARWSGLATGAGLDGSPEPASVQPA